MLGKSNISKVTDENGKFTVTAKNVIFFERPTINGRLYSKESMSDILQQMREKNIPVYIRPLAEDIFAEQPIGMMDKNSVVADEYNISCDFEISDKNVQELLKQELVSFSIEYI